MTMTDLHTFQLDRVDNQLRQDEVTLTQCAHTIIGMKGRTLLAVRSRLVELQQTYKHDPLWCLALSGLFKEVEEITHDDPEALERALDSYLEKVITAREKTGRLVRKLESERFQSSQISPWPTTVAPPCGLNSSVANQLKARLLADSGTFLTITHQLWEALNSEQGSGEDITMKTAYEIIEERAQQSDLFEQLQTHLKKVAPQTEREMASIMAQAHRYEKIISRTGKRYFSSHDIGVIRPPASGSCTKGGAYRTGTSRAPTNPEGPTQKATL